MIQLLLQGFMNVTSAGRGHGSTFFFELPIYRPDYSPPQRQEEPKQPQHRSGQSPQPKPVRVESKPRLLRPSSVACEGLNEDRYSAYVVQNDSPEPLLLSPTVQCPTVGPDSAAVMPEGKLVLLQSAMVTMALNSSLINLQGIDRWPALALESVEHCETPLTLRLMIVVYSRLLSDDGRLPTIIMYMYYLFKLL